MTTHQCAITIAVFTSTVFQKMRSRCIQSNLLFVLLCSGLIFFTSVTLLLGRSCENIDVCAEISETKISAIKESALNQELYAVNDELRKIKEKQATWMNTFYDNNSIPDLYGTGLNNEFEVIPFTRFTYSRLYLVDPGLGRRVIEKPIGYKKAEIYDVVQRGIIAINSHNKRQTIVQNSPDRILKTKASQDGIKDNAENMGLSGAWLHKDIGAKNESIFSDFVDVDDFQEGIYRTVPALGSVYELYFMKHSDNGLQKESVREKGWVKSEWSTEIGRSEGEAERQWKVIIRRRFGRPVLTSVFEISQQRLETLIVVILPLSGKINVFHGFMHRFRQVCLVSDGNVRLVIVYFGTDGLPDVQAVASNMTKTFGHDVVQLALTNEPFSRARGLQIGADHVRVNGAGRPAVRRKIRGGNGGITNSPRSNPLLFLCDVDVIFSVDFLQRCRLNTESGKRIYYPIVFSLYNPAIVDFLKLRSNVDYKDEADKIAITRETGFWRDFGYGMTCQYLSDFLAASRPPSSPSQEENLPPVQSDNALTGGWGLEDVVLYRAHVQSDVFVLRATDPGIFHAWHEKHCDEHTLSAAQLRGCVRSKALNEASHAQLGVLYFKNNRDLSLGR